MMHAFYLKKYSPDKFFYFFWFKEIKKNLKSGSLARYINRIKIRKQRMELRCLVRSRIQRMSFILNLNLKFL